VDATAPGHRYSARVATAFLVDEHDWAFGTWAHGLAPRLGGRVDVYSLDDLERAAPGVIAAYDTWVLASWYAAEKYVDRFARDCRVWITAADEFSWPGNETFARLLARAGGGAIATSRAIAAELERAFPTARVVYVPNGVDVAAFTVARERAAVATVGWAGSTRYHGALKGVELIEAAVAQLGPAVTLRKADAAVARIPHAAMPRWYAGVDCVAIASASESGPLPLLEALAAGCAVVTTRVGLVPELAAAGAALEIVDRDAAAIAAGLRRALAAPDAAARAAHNRDIVRAHFDFARVAAQLAATITDQSTARATTRSGPRA
jgi:glycosyltransferase involved in cell wall biosynthesis